eukprot:1559120-Alexandrium_andersonii.AAC.1
MRAAVRPKASRNGPSSVSKAPSSAVDRTATPSGCHGTTPPVGSSPPAEEKAARLVGSTCRPESASFATTRAQHSSKSALGRTRTVSSWHKRARALGKHCEASRTARAMTRPKALLLPRSPWKRPS